MVVRSSVLDTKPAASIMLCASRKRLPTTFGTRIFLTVGVALGDLEGDGLFVGVLVAVFVGVLVGLSGVGVYLGGVLCLVRVGVGSGSSVRVLLGFGDLVEGFGLAMSMVLTVGSGSPMLVMPVRATAVAPAAEHDRRGDARDQPGPA